MQSNSLIDRLANPLAFTAVLIVWSTTPLAVTKSIGQTPLTSATARMVVGVLFCLFIIFITKHTLPFNRQTLRLYGISAFSIFASMSLIYLAAETIPSGWIAVIFGLSPIVTGLFALPYETEAKMDAVKFCGLVLGCFGLYMVFSAGIEFSQVSSSGIFYVLGAVVTASASSVAMRQLTQHVDVSGMQLTTGGVLIAIPFFLLSALLSENVSQVSFTREELVAILYLGFIGTGIGFTCYFFLLKRMAASRVALITLVTPISALAIGAWVNNEPLLPGIWLGATCVTVGILLYEFKPKLGLRKL
ncbi:MAG: DMT family transporter [Pseudomonadota bacterium]